jgi:hypothetical protein
MRHLCLIGLALSLVASTAVVHAAEPGRTLNGYDFMPSEVVESPFAVTHFGTLTGGGLAFDVKTPFIDLEGEEIGTLEGDVAFLALGFRFQQRFGNWFAARFGFMGGARMGVNEQSVLAQGVTGTFGLRLGGIARILQTEKVILSGSLDFTRTDLVGLDPYGFVQRVVEDGLDNDNNELVASGSAYSTRLAALCGWAPKNWLGINGYVEAGQGEYTEDDNETILGGGLTGGVDFKNLDIIPIGVQLVARTTGITSGEADLATRSWTYGMGFFYTGWDEFSISFEASMNTFQRRGDGEDFESFVGSFNIRYWP